MFYKPLVEKGMIEGSEHGQVEKPVSTLSHGAESLEQLSLHISGEYAKLVQEHPDYEFGIVADNIKSTIRITWVRRKETD